MIVKLSAKVKFFLLCIFVLNFSISFGDEQEKDQNIEEETTIDLEEIRQIGKIKYCQYEGDKTLELIFLKSGKAYLILNDTVQEIPISDELNTEDLEITCKEKEIIIISKMPLTNILQKHTFFIRNYKIERMGSSIEDSTSNYFNYLFDLVRKGRKDLILSESLKVVNYSYQYITAEEFEKLSNDLIDSSSNNNIDKKIKIYDAFGILTSKLILFYHSNVKEFDSYPLEDFKFWISLWEELGWTTYEKFLVEYSKLFLSKHSRKGIMILEELINKKPNYLQSYIVLADFYWNNKDKQESLKIYKKILSKEKDFVQNDLSLIPEYIKNRVSGLEDQ